MNKEIKVGKPKRTPIWRDEYIDPLAGNSHTMTDMGLERMAADLVKWANTKDAFTITQFFVPKGIPPGTWHRWINQCEILKNAQDMAKELIAIRREVGVATGKLRSDMIKPVHGYYSSVWREEQDRASQINNITSGIQVVEIEKSPSSDLVPVLKRD